MSIETEKAFERGFAAGFEAGRKTNPLAHAPLPLPLPWPMTGAGLQKCPVCQMQSFNNYVCTNSLCPSRITNVSSVSQSVSQTASS